MVLNADVLKVEAYWDSSLCSSSFLLQFFVYFRVLSACYSTASFFLLKPSFFRVECFQKKKNKGQRASWDIKSFAGSYIFSLWHILNFNCFWQLLGCKEKTVICLLLDELCICSLLLKTASWVHNSCLVLLALSNSRFFISQLDFPNG